MMMLWSPRREWAGRADRRRPQLSVACKHERLFPGRAGHRTEVGAGQLTSRVARQPEGILGSEVRSGWGKELWEVEEGIGSEAEEV